MVNDHHALDGSNAPVRVESHDGGERKAPIVHKSSRPTTRVALNEIGPVEVGEVAESTHDRLPSVSVSKEYRALGLEAALSPACVASRRSSTRGWLRGDEGQEHHVQADVAVGAVVERSGHRREDLEAE
jgi:hypothetical protein